MKTTALLGILLLSVICFSCQSEYERQLANGKELIKREIALRNAQDNNIGSMPKLSGIRQELHKCAHLSGNESLFKAELIHYESNLMEQTTINPNRLISKYP